ncbi:MAG: hypothetical protein ACRELG_04450 [Gemmataceae bacterium]
MRAPVDAVDVGKASERTIVVCGGTTSGKQGGFWSKQDELNKCTAEGK